LTRGADYKICFMGFIFYFLLFICGLIVGSFLNVVILRYRPKGKILEGKVIGGRSHCPFCFRILTFYELIPIFSFFIQKGLCRGCGRKISPQYPLVELLSGLIFVFVPMSLSYDLRLADYHFSFLQLSIVGCWIFIFILLLLLSAIDLRHSIIPNQINLTLGLLGLILIIISDYYDRFSLLTGSFFKNYAAIFGLRDNIWTNHLFAALLGMAFFGLIIFLSKEKAMGWGDFKLIGALGLIFGWPDILIIIFSAFIIGAIAGIIFLIGKKKRMKDAVPFGPFLAIGSTLIFFFGYQIIGGYFRLFGL